MKHQNNIPLGAWGEEKAVEILREKGYQILTQNYRCPCGEIDIIAKEGSRLVFVEVKTRKSSQYGLPCQAVTAAKLGRMRRTALHYVTVKGCYSNAVRMDVMELLLIEKHWYYRHLTDVE